MFKMRFVLQTVKTKALLEPYSIDTVIYNVLTLGSVSVPLRANSVIASALLSPQTFRIIEKAVQTAKAAGATDSRRDMSTKQLLLF